MSEGYTAIYVENMGPEAAARSMNALANARIKESNRALDYENIIRAIRTTCADILHGEGNKPGYELREFCEEWHAISDQALKKGNLK